jgi:hypothetical protein
MGIFDFFKNKKDKESTTDNKSEREIKKKVKFHPISGVSTIVKYPEDFMLSPEEQGDHSKSYLERWDNYNISLYNKFGGKHGYYSPGLRGYGKRFYGNCYDLRRNKIPNIPKSHKIRSFKNKCYLGKKTLQSGKIKWVDLDPEEIKKSLQDSEFIIRHSEKTKDEINGDKRIIKEKEMNKLKKTKTSLLKEFDVDNNGTLDLIEIDEFNKLLKKHQSKIIKIDREYIKQFVKISLYLKNKRDNLQIIFKSLKKSKSHTELNNIVGLLKNQIHTFKLLSFHSLTMITSLVYDDMITFYEVYEKFDKLKIFNSIHENEVSEQLKSINQGISNVNNGLYQLMSSIQQMETSIVSEIGHLSYMTESSFGELEQNLTSELKSVNSSIGINNLLTGINTYQLYKIGKNTKSLRG